MKNKIQKTILVVEDDPIIAAFNKNSLESYGYFVFTATSGVSAIDLIKTNSFIDLIVMDIDLGEGLDGTETAECILKEHDIPIVFLSSHTEPEIVEKTEKITSYGYVVKNSTITVLDASIKMAFKLFDANQKLKNELSERIKANQEQKYHFLIKNSIVGMVVNRNGIITYANPAALKILGANSIEELSQKKAIDYIHPDYQKTIKKEIITIFKENKNGPLKEMKFVQFSGSIIDVELQNSIIQFANHPAVLTIFHDITIRKKADEKIQSLLKEKEIILQEVHHRIKNNLSIIMSMLMIQSNNLDDSIAQEALNKACSRIRSMTLLYDKLYLSSNYENIQISDYIPVLINEIIENFPNKKPISIEHTIDDFVLNSKRLQNISIIINELLTNSIKHAFSEKENGNIFISVELVDNTVTLFFKDNGKGMPDINIDSGFGLTLIRDLTKQLKGNIQMESKGGLEIKINFPLKTK